MITQKEARKFFDLRTIQSFTGPKYIIESYTYLMAKIENSDNIQI